MTAAGGPAGNTLSTLAGNSTLRLAESKKVSAPAAMASSATRVAAVTAAARRPVPTMPDIQSDITRRGKHNLRPAAGGAQYSFCAEGGVSRRASERISGVE